MLAILVTQLDSSIVNLPTHVIHFCNSFNETVMYASVIHWIFLLLGATIRFF